MSVTADMSLNLRVTLCSHMSDTMSDRWSNTIFTVTQKCTIKSQQLPPVLRSVQSGLQPVLSQMWQFRGLRRLKGCDNISLTVTSKCTMKSQRLPPVLRSVERGLQSVLSHICSFLGLRRLKNAQ